MYSKELEAMAQVAAREVLIGYTEVNFCTETRTQMYGRISVL